MRKTAIALALIMCLTGVAHAAEPQAPSAADLQGDWNATYQCGQDRLHFLGSPFEWQIPFTIEGDTIAGNRAYIDVNAGLSVAFFRGLVVDQGSGFEIGMAVPHQDGEVGLHARFAGRVTAQQSFNATGYMLSHDNQVLRQCELHLLRDGANTTASS